MINQGKFRDRANFIKFAGKTQKLTTGENVVSCLKTDLKKQEKVK